MNIQPSLGIVAAGLSSTLQDRGRRGLRRAGIPWAGTLAEPWRRIANALVGNPADAAVIETFEGGLTVEPNESPVRIASAGDLTLEISRQSERVARVDSWRSLLLQPGETLRIVSTGDYRLGVLAIGGIDAPKQHGSTSCYARAGLGGLDGGPLRAGQRIAATPASRDPDLAIGAGDLPACLAFGSGYNPQGASGPSAHGPGTLVLRAVAGPQDEAFDSDQLARFFGGTRWTMGTGSDRMGCRLEGTPLRHRRTGGADIVSDAILPGSVQVPGAGQPIVLLNDAHTAGGYAKIATVIGADLMSLAVGRPGTTILFERVEAAQGVRLAREREAVLNGLLERLQRLARQPDSAFLLRVNLIGGAVDALACDPA